MNFLSEVLSTADEIQAINIKDKLPKIAAEIKKLKIEVKTYMEHSVEFKFLKKKNQDFLQDADKLNADMMKLKESFDNVMRKEHSNVAQELSHLGNELDETISALKISSQLIHIDQSLKKHRQLKMEKKYLEASEEIVSVQNYMLNIPADERLEILDSIIMNTLTEQQGLLGEIRALWSKQLVLDKQVIDNVVNIVLKVNYSNTDELEECIKSLACGNSNVLEFNMLATFLFEEVLDPIINHNVTMLISKNGKYSILKIMYDPSSPKADISHIVDNIQTIFDYLALSINFNINSETPLLWYIGKRINKKFSDLFIEKCLSDYIPVTPSDLKEYSVVAQYIQTLQLIFTDCQFFTEDDDFLLQHVNNVDILSANKSCQMFLDRARTIMKKDLHDMKEVELDSSSVLHETFPKCYVSRNTIELIELVTEMLKQAHDSSHMCASRLFYTSKEIFDLYSMFVPEYHKKLLETIPQQVALFHNNCSYLAHELLNLAKLSKQELPKEIVANDWYADQVESLTTAGTNAFLKHIRMQIIQIEDIIKNSELVTMAQMEKLGPNTERSIRQCLRQLELLKTVWQKVLNCDLYNKTIGDILNAFLDYLIEIVVTFEDISQNNCTLLMELFHLIQTRVPKLFTEPKEINLYVKKWCKFNELVKFFDSNLMEINERWTDGKGPLAMVFKPEEVRKLIRAVFQNTDRRSAVLSRIN